MDQTATSIDDLAAMATRLNEIRRTAQTGSRPLSRRTNGGQRSWPLAAGGFTGTASRAAQCLLRLARDSEIDWHPIAQPAEPPDADPHVRWCDRDSWRQPTYVDFTGLFYGHLGNGLTRMIWDHETPGSNPGCPTS